MCLLKSIGGLLYFSEVNREASGLTPVLVVGASDGESSVGLDEIDFFDVPIL